MVRHGSSWCRRPGWSASHAGDRGSSSATNSLRKAARTGCQPAGSPNDALATGGPPRTNAAIRRKRPAGATRPDRRRHPAGRRASSPGFAEPTRPGLQPPPDPGPLHQGSILSRFRSSAGIREGPPSPLPPSKRLAGPRCAWQVPASEAVWPLMGVLLPNVPLALRPHGYPAVSTAPPPPARKLGLP